MIRSAIVYVYECLQAHHGLFVLAKLCLETRDPRFSGSGDRKARSQRDKAASEKGDVLPEPLE